MLRNIALVIGLAALSGCGGGGFSLSNLNPFTWGQSDPADVQSSRIAAARETLNQQSDGRVLLPSVGAVRYDPTPTGLILIVSGETVGLGYANAGLRALRNGRADETGTITYQVVATPLDTVAGGPRALTLATYVSNSRLRNASTLRIQAANNEQIISLR